MLRRLGQRRNAAVRRIDDQRGALAAVDGGVPRARIEPEIVVAADVAVRARRAVAARRRRGAVGVDRRVELLAVLRDLLFELLRLFVGQHQRRAGAALERRDASRDRRCPADRDGRRPVAARRRRRSLPASRVCPSDRRCLRRQHRDRRQQRCAHVHDLACRILLSFRLARAASRSDLVTHVQPRLSRADSTCREPRRQRGRESDARQKGCSHVKSSLRRADSTILPNSYSARRSV